VTLTALLFHPPLFSRMHMNGDFLRCVCEFVPTRCFASLISALFRQALSSSGPNPSLFPFLLRPSWDGKRRTLIPSFDPYCLVSPSGVLVSLHPFLPPLALRLEKLQSPIASPPVNCSGSLSLMLSNLRLTFFCCFLATPPVTFPKLPGSPPERWS